MPALLSLAAALLYAVAGLIAHAAVSLTVLVVALTTDVFNSPVVLDTVSWGLIAGVVTPLLTSIVQQPKWSNRTRAVVGALVSIVIGVLTCLVNGDLHWGEGQTVLSTIAAVLVAAHATYGQLWKPARVAPAIEKATSPGKPAAG